MELYQLKTFIVVAEQGHLTRAAERLHLSQPAVSAHIKALEDELGVALFKREPKGMRLTEEGRLLKPKAELAILAADEVSNHARMLQSEVMGDVRLGLNTDMEFLRVAPILVAMKERYPRVDISLFKSLSGRILEDLTADRLDAGFVFGEYDCPDLDFTMISRVRVCIVAPKAWEDKVMGAGWKDLAGMPWIWTPPHCPFHTLAAKVFEEQDLNPKKVILADSDTVLRGLVAAGAGLSHLIEREALMGEAAGELVIWDGADMYMSAWFVLPRRKLKDRAVLALKKEVCRAWKVEAAPVQAP